MTQEALRLALEALEKMDKVMKRSPDTDKAITAIKEALAQPEQEPVAWPCLIAEADFSEDTVTLAMQCTDYKVSAGKHWLSNTPPQRTWVGLTDEDMLEAIKPLYANPFLAHNALEVSRDEYQAIEAKLKEKNT